LIKVIPKDSALESKPFDGDYFHLKFDTNPEKASPLKIVKNEEQDLDTISFFTIKLLPKTDKIQKFKIYASQLETDFTTTKVYAQLTHDGAYPGFWMHPLGQIKTDYEFNYDVENHRLTSQRGELQIAFDQNNENETVLFVENENPKAKQAFICFQSQDEYSVEIKKREEIENRSKENEVQKYNESDQKNKPEIEANSITQENLNAVPVMSLLTAYLLAVLY
jgi:hypothetical protein